ncbi:uncharacterized protein LOC104905213 [Beta vulgaris subsp. vulgaris]|uniref:uncharacterized protein LOC104905213 n=1 Tax=Beta vulgaris subsp. vulgaris TaxID=3555 RepID=UPI002036A64A|nr:uncharacterized protein LOC104905213 [Beta vulgaris subsp. vulgaris]
MRCKKHLSDYSSSVGVCASCLRERLFFLVEAQSQLKSNYSDYPNPNCNNRNNNNSTNSLSSNRQQQQPQPPPLIFPRSVSPYISRRKSDQTVAGNSKPVIQRFYSTPQVGPTKKKNAGKFNLITRLFRSKSSVVSSSSNSEVGIAELTRRSNRGMSPENEWEDEVTRPSPGRVRPSPARLANNVANLALCLSPLVRGTPASRSHWGIESSFSGEIRVPAIGKSNSGSCNVNNHKKKPHLGDAASFCANRSRKLADFGRLNRNR